MGAAHMRVGRCVLAACTQRSPRMVQTASRILDPAPLRTKHRVRSRYFQHAVKHRCLVLRRPY